MQCPGIRFGESLHYLWPGSAKHTFDRCIQSLHAVTDVALQDLDAEVNGFVLDFCVFDLKSFHQAKQKPGEWETYKRLTDLRIRRLVESGLKKSAYTKTLREWWCAAHCLQEELAPKFDAGEEVDNRTEWRRVWEDSFVQRATSWKRFNALPSFVNYYLGFRDSSTGVERALAVVERLRQAHLGPLGLTLHDLAEIILDGPQSETELATRLGQDGEHPVLQATDMCVEMVSIWRSLFGARFRLYKPRADAGRARGKRSGTDADIVRRTTAGANLLVCNAGRVGEGSVTILGVKRKDLPRHEEAYQKNPQFNQDLEDLYNSAAEKKQKKLDMRNQRRDHPETSVYRPGPLRKATLLADATPAPRSAAFDYTRKRAPKIVDLTLTGPSVQCEAGTVMRPGNSHSMGDILAFVRGCDLIVVSSFKHLQCLPKFNDILRLGCSSRIATNIACHLLSV